MLAKRESTQAFQDYAPFQPPCPNCGRPMHLDHKTLNASAVPVLRTFKCGECGVSLIESD
jgi:hypothetical protein